MGYALSDLPDLSCRRALACPVCHVRSIWFAQSYLSDLFCLFHLV